MPLMDGLTAAREIRRLGGEAAAVPIVALSANVLPEQVSQISASGMNGYLTKPFRQVEMHEVLLKFLGAAKAEETPSTAAVAPSIDEAMLESMSSLIARERFLGFMEALDARIEELTLNRETLPPQALEALAHGIAGEAGMLGLLRLAAAARAVEHSDDVDASDAWAEWLGAAEEARARLKTILETA
jgi:CheY-like chemotaxis protein